MEEMTVSVAINRKIALKGYENVDIRMEVHNVEAGASEEEIEEALATGDLAVEMLKKHIGFRIRELRASNGEMG